MSSERNGHLVPCLRIEQTTGFLLVDAAPLLKEERDTNGDALVTNWPNPFGLHGPCARPRLTAHNHPVDIRQVQGLHWADERFHGKKTDSCRHGAQIGNPAHAFGILDSHPHPEVVGPMKFGGESGQAVCALGEDLVNVMRCFCDNAKHLLDEGIGHILVEEVAHGVDEDSLWLPPFQRKIQCPFVARDPKAMSVVGLPHGLQAFCHTLGIAIQTAGADLCAAGDGVPRCLGPFDGGV